MQLFPDAAHELREFNHCHEPGTGKFSAYCSGRPAPGPFDFGHVRGEVIDRHEYAAVMGKEAARHATKHREVLIRHHQPNNPPYVTSVPLSVWQTWHNGRGPTPN